MAIQRISSDQLSANSVNVLTNLITTGVANANTYLSGTGQWQTVGGVSTSSVSNAISGSAVDSVGSYALIRFTNNTIGTPGSDHVAGTLLAFSNCTGSTVGNGGNPYYASGTWKTMGDVPSSGTTNTKTTVMLRIA